MSKKRDVTEANPTPEEFVKAWMSSKSLAEVSDKTGLAPTIAAARASLYRKKYNLNLPHFRPGRKAAINVPELNKLIESMGGKPADDLQEPAKQVEGKTPEQLRQEQVEAQKRNAALVKRLLGGKPAKT